MADGDAGKVIPGVDHRWLVEDPGRAALDGPVQAARDHLVQSFAAVSLGEIGAVSAADHLLLAYRKGQPTLVPHAALALDRLDDEGRRPRRLQLLGEEPLEVGQAGRAGGGAAGAGPGPLVVVEGRAEPESVVGGTGLRRRCTRSAAMPALRSSATIAARPS